MKILIVEDEMLLADSLKTLLEKKGFTVECVYDGEAGAEYAETGVYDLLILDVMVPKMNGYQVARSVRAKRCGTPILMLTARSGLEDRIEGLNAGADYYLTKPFDSRELVACINALLRRTMAAGERSTLVHKGLELDLARSMVTNTPSGYSTELTKNELRILSLLLSRAGKIVSRSAIMQDLWDSDAFVDDNTLTVNINRLRTTLEKIGIKGYLTTHRGQGYSV